MCERMEDDALGDEGDESDVFHDEADLITESRRDFEGESGYDTDPVDRFLAINDWQRQLRTLQSKLQSPLVKRASSARKNIQKGQEKVVSTIKRTPAEIRQRTEKRLNAVNARIEKGLAKMRSKKMRQMRHIVCFVCSITNGVVMSFWLGKWPQTFHYWYTANCLWLIGCRAIWYRWQNYHYYLLDMCYWVNAGLLVYLWFFAESEWMLQGLCGFSGVLMISIPLFRNSFVPHSLDRVTSFHIHMTPVIQLWVTRWPESHRAADWAWKVPEEMSIIPALTLYLYWAIFYYTYLFVIRSSVIEKKGYETLYKHFTVNMGLEAKLPKHLQGPIMTRCVFIVGHLVLFLSGVFVVHLPYWGFTACMCISAIWGFRNGARFYMTYFWRVYEEQITAFEKERAKAEQKMQEQHQVRKNSRAEELFEGELAADRSSHLDADDDMD